MKLLLALAAVGLGLGCGGGGGLKGAAGDTGTTGVAGTTGAAGGQASAGVAGGQAGSTQNGPAIIADLSSGAPLNKMWGASAGDLWLAGGGSWPPPGGGSLILPIGSGPQPARLVNLKSNGQTMQVRDFAPAVPGPLTAIWGSAADDIWVLGDRTFGHFDGTIWRPVDAPFGDPALPPFGATAGAIWGASRSDVWFAGARRMLHWDGVAWSDVPIPGGAAYGIGADNLLSLWGFSSTDVWAGGASGTLIHWDGKAWSSVPTGSTLWVYALWGSAPNALWGVGNGGYRLRWDGTDLQQADQLFTSFVAIGGRAANDVWGVGECCWDRQYAAWLSHFDGATWSSTSYSTLAHFQDVWVGIDGTVLGLADGSKVVRLR